MPPLDRSTIPQVPPGPSGDQIPDSGQLALIQWVFDIQEEGYGPQAQQAVAALQRENAIAVDPQVMIGPRTWALLVDRHQRKVASLQIPSVPSGPTGEQLPTAEQLALIQWVFDITEEGYGPRTRAAVAALQQANGIPVDSAVMIGPRTWSLLLGLYRQKVGDEGKTTWQIPGTPYRGDGSSAEEVFMNAQIYRLNTQLVPPAASRYVRNKQIVAMQKAGNPPTSEMDRPPYDHPEVAQVIERLTWTQAKVDRLWAKANEIGIDPRVMLAVLFQEGTGSFNTNAEVPVQYWTGTRYVQGGSGPQPDFEEDLADALGSHILAKVRAYGYYAAQFQQAVEANGLGDGNLFQYVNWISPWVKPSGWVVRPGPYATHTLWWRGLQTYFDKLCGEGATHTYSLYMAAHPAPVNSSPPAVRFALTRNGTTEDDTVGNQPWIEAFQA